MRASETQVYDVEIGVGTRWTNTRIREVGSGDKKLRFGKRKVTTCVCVCVCVCTLYEDQSEKRYRKDGF